MQNKNSGTMKCRFHPDVKRISQLSGVPLSEVENVFNSPSSNRKQIEEITAIAIKNGNEALLYTEFLISQQRMKLQREPTKPGIKKENDKKEMVKNETPQTQEQFLAELKDKKEALKNKKASEESETEKLKKEIIRIRARFQEDPQSLLVEKKQLEQEFFENSTLFVDTYGENATMLLRLK